MSEVERINAIFREGLTYRSEPFPEKWQPTHITTYYEDENGILCASTMDLKTGEVKNEAVCHFDPADIKFWLR